MAATSTTKLTSPLSRLAQSMITNGYKLELESLSSKSPGYLTETFLINKIREVDYL